MPLQDSGQQDSLFMKKYVLFLVLSLILGCSSFVRNVDKNYPRPAVPHELDLSEGERLLLDNPDNASADDAFKIARYYLLLQNDEKTAILWFERAQMLGNKEAHKFLDTIKSYED